MCFPNEIANFAGSSGTIGTFTVTALTLERLYNFIFLGQLCMENLILL